MEDKELTREEKLDLEEKAIEALLSYGVKFSVPLKIEPKNPPRWFRLLCGNRRAWRDKRIPKNWSVEIEDVTDINEERIRKVYMRKFHIKPLYLGTIDMIRKLGIEIEYNEGKVQENAITEGERLMKYTPLMAKIAALATLNKPEIADENDKETKELQKFYMTHLTVARLQKLCAVINKMMDKAGFITSIRLIQQVDTTTPKADRVELSD